MKRVILSKYIMTNILDKINRVVLEGNTETRVVALCPTCTTKYAVGVGNRALIRSRYPTSCSLCMCPPSITVVRYRMPVATWGCILDDWAQDPNRIAYDR